MLSSMQHLCNVIIQLHLISQVAIVNINMQMKNLIISSVSITALVFLISCNSPIEKVEKAQGNVEEANSDLQVANQEYLQEVETYRTQATEKISSNEQNIREFNARIESKKKDANEEYKNKVADLDKKNNDMKKRMADYRATSRENWETFKSEFDHDMEELGKAFRDLTVNNVK